MSEHKQWKSIWEKSVEANCSMISDLHEGANEFKTLLSEHSDDGMIYYEYAEAFEYHEEYGLALENYKKAKELFPREEWKAIAQAGIERVKYPEKELPENFETIYHKIHLIKYLNMYPTLKYMVLFSMAKSLDDKTLCLLTARTIIETVVLDYLNPNEEITREVNLFKEIEKLKEKEISEKIIKKLHNIRLAGNAVVHLRSNGRAKDLASDLEKRMFDLYDIIEEFYS